MEYLNEPVDDTLFEKVSAFVYNLTDSEMYCAESIHDFLKEKDRIKPTRNFLPFTKYFNGYGMVQFPFLQYKPQSPDAGITVDVSGALEVRLDWTLGRKVRIPAEYKEELTDGTQLYNPVIGYVPKEDVSYLIYWHLHGPPTEESQEELFFTPLLEPT